MRELLTALAVVAVILWSNVAGGSLPSPQWTHDIHLPHITYLRMG